MRTFALRTRVGLLGDPRRDEAVFAHDEVAGAVLDGALDLGQLVAGSYEEQMWIVAHLLVRREGHVKTFQAAAVGAFAQERAGRIVRAFVQLLDSLVHLAKEGLIASCAFLDELQLRAWVSVMTATTVRLSSREVKG